MPLCVVPQWLSTAPLPRGRENSRTSSLVSRASQTQYVPQVGRPPQCACHQRQQGKSGAYRRTRNHQDFHQADSPDQGNKAEDRHDRVDHHRGPCAWYVHVHDARAFALQVIRRRPEQAPVRPDGRQHQEYAPQPGNQAAGNPIEVRRRAELVKKDDEGVLGTHETLILRAAPVASGISARAPSNPASNRPRNGV